MKLTKLRILISDARNIASMDNASFRNITAHPSMPPLFEDGRAVTEFNVTEFIKERTKLWRESWIVYPLVEAIDMIDAERRDRDAT